MIGPYFAYLVDGKAKNSAQGTLFDIEKNLSNTDYNRFDGGIALGLSFDANPVSLGIRYNYGLQKVGLERNYAGNNYTFPNGKNSVLNLYVSYSIL